MLNDKAKIIWSNDDLTTSRPILEMINDNNFVDVDEISSVHDVNSEKNEGQRLRGGTNGHVFIDRDTDISYYDDGGENPVEAASSSSFLAVNSANRSHFIILMLGQYISIGWLIFEFF
ncbi:unnamed protein product [Onchocerca flexuosa]|uniref:Anaphase-promoting complex subunit 13 n=1 Tax=Onchocerca flexuosa TaxID=387005 RepID=A0A183HVJ5_9BILA|nr:unnamed protein product [Onchocerca flexuosa]